MQMRDPYLYENEPILRNKLNIHKKDLLEDAEAIKKRMSWAVYLLNIPSL